MPPSPSCPPPARWRQMWASGLLLCWQRWLGPYSVCLFVCLFFSGLWCSLRFQNSSQTCLWEGFLQFRHFSSFPKFRDENDSPTNSSLLFFRKHELSYFSNYSLHCGLSPSTNESLRTIRNKNRKVHLSGFLWNLCIYSLKNPPHHNPNHFLINFKFCLLFLIW